MPETLLSVVTISFNQARFLEDCIRSVVSQKRPGVEYIVVDAGSTDGSRDIINRYAGDIDKIILEPDDGPADGLNKGFSRASGSIFYYVNADDRVLPGAFSYALQYFDNHPATDVLCGAAYMFDEQGRRHIRKRTSDEFDAVRYAAGVCTVVQQATFFRRKAFNDVGGFNAENRIAWDGEILVDMALAGCHFDSVHKLLGEFRIYGGTITGSPQYREKYAKYEQQIDEKLEHARQPIAKGWNKKLMRAAYKLNLLRHIGYFLVR